MRRGANVFKWVISGALVGLIFAVALAKLGISDDLRPYGLAFLDRGYTSSMFWGAIFGVVAAAIRDWWQRMG